MGFLLTLSPLELCLFSLFLSIGVSASTVIHVHNLFITILIKYLMLWIGYGNSYELLTVVGVNSHFSFRTDVKNH